MGPDDGALMGAGLAGMIGLALLGPWGLVAGGVFGFGAGSAMSSSGVESHDVIKKVKKWFVDQRADAGSTVTAVRERIGSVVEPALDALRARTLQDVREVFRSKLREFRERLADLEEPAQDAEEKEIQRERAEAMLEKLRRTQSSSLEVSLRE